MASWAKEKVIVDQLIESWAIQPVNAGFAEGDIQAKLSFDERRA
jgi:hypothetical protein